MRNARDLELEHLRREVARLETLVDRIAGIRPRSIWAAEDEPAAPMLEPTIHYQAALRFPRKQVLTVRAGLDMEFWDQPYGREVLGEFIRSATRALGYEVDREMGRPHG
jgi:hypothetical protein